MPVELNEKRKDERLSSCFLIDYVLNASGSSDFHKAVTINVSETGLCLLAFKALHAGEKIIIRNDIQKRNSATICWTKKLDEDVYKIGVFFN